METRLTRQEGLWVKYQLALHGYSLGMVAKEVGCVYSMITHFLAGNKGSERVNTGVS